jgi:hypothetical protein
VKIQFTDWSIAALNTYTLKFQAMINFML